MVLDMRVRPPYGGYLNTIMFRDTERTAGFTRRLGMEQPESVRKLSVEMMLREMEEAGIDMGVIPGRMANPNFGTVPNEDIDAFLKAYPGRFLGLAGIDPLREDAILEIEKWVIKGDMKGIVMEPGVLTTPLYADHRSIYPVYEYCQVNDILVTLMAGGNAGPDVTYSMPTAVDHVAIEFPRMRILVYHGGWPWAAPMIHVAMRRDNVYLSPDMYMMNTPGSQDFISAANYTLPDKIVFGTAYPFVPFQAGLDYFLHCGIKEERMEDLLYYNGARLLGMVR